MLIHAAALLCMAATAGTMAPVQPQKISSPSEGRSEVHFRLRATGADVAVQLTGMFRAASSR